MKITVDIHDALLMRAKRYARRMGCPLRAVIEDGLRRVLDAPAQRRRYRLPDLSTGDPDAPNPLENFSWPELREIIYRDRDK